MPAGAVTRAGTALSFVLARSNATRASSAPSWEREHPLWDSLALANVTGVLLAFASLKLISLDLELCQYSELGDLQIRHLR